MFHFFFLLLLLLWHILVNIKENENDNDNQTVTKNTNNCINKNEKQHRRTFKYRTYRHYQQKSMTTNNSSERDKQDHWFTRIFSFKKKSLFSSNRIISLTNPNFESFGDILRPKRTTEHRLRFQNTTIDEALVDIAINSENDISSLADKSKGTLDFFHTSSVNEKYIE